MRISDPPLGFFFDKQFEHETSFIRCRRPECTNQNASCSYWQSTGPYARYRNVWRWCLKLLPQVLTRVSRVISFRLNAGIVSSPGLPLPLGRALQAHQKPPLLPKIPKGIRVPLHGNLQPQATRESFTIHYKTDIFDSTLNAALPRNLISTASVATPINQSIPHTFAYAVHSVG